MKVYELKNNNKAMLLAAVEDRNHPINFGFNGETKEQIWSPIEVETLYKRTYKDFPVYRIGKPVISAKVKRAIESFISSEVEFLPLVHKELELYMINVTNILDCVDWERTDVEWTEENSFAGFNKLVFDFSKIPEHTYIFKFKELATVAVYVTEEFKELIERNKFKGLDFEFTEVYDSEFTEEKEQEQKLAYEAAIAAVEQNKGQEFSYEEAVERVNQGVAVASGKWKMQLDGEGRFWLGEIILGLTYQWIMPVYIPPVLLSFQWHEIQKSEI
ncbi:imm11 family protein [Paenibacillus sp. IHBB 10380]|uniref:imm11 family protein n=1 Tax=Paenibacillus sp. IHBB 10380 TaxID=1566358 RepID=UPI0005CFAFC7|nr:DUF1629 domain-containing protein [Paenibacillus sp. IHBB 10380]AJS61133.1 hypothetical protein UB51_24890 [Paenibacillus sp. IHBB 10380]